MTAPLKNQKLNQNGFTLVEIVVTAALVAVASTAIIGIFISIGELNRHSRNLAMATAIAEQKIETYRDAGYNAVPVGTPAETFTGSLPDSLGSPKSAVTNVTVVAAGLKRVDIVINYTEGKKLKKVQTSTLMAQRGINR